MPTDRRTLLKLLGATAGASAFGAAPRALAQDGVSLERPAGWDYPAVDALLPFGHGVKSGDPLHDRVVIWTRVSIPDPGGWLVAMPQGIGEVDVAWVVARDRA
ncbi:PhoD-like phosphatase N-terminal domain-containing protein, partial [Algiphilus sp.]